MRAHLRRKVDEGATVAWLAAQSGVAEKTVASVPHAPRPTVRRATADPLLGIDGAPPVPQRRVDPRRTVARVAKLQARHWSLTAIARAAGVAPCTLLERNTRTGVSAQTAAGVDRASEALRGREGPAPRPYPWLAERITPWTVDQVRRAAGVSAASVSRIRAGRPIGREVARRVHTWLAVQDADQRLAAARRDGSQEAA